MNPIYVPLFSALAGAVIGSISSIAAIFIQAKYSERRERIRQAMTLALEDYKFKLSNAAPGTFMLPLSTYLHHQAAILEALEENDLTPARLRKIHAENNALIEASWDIEKEWRKKERERIVAEQSAKD